MVHESIGPQSQQSRALPCSPPHPGLDIGGARADPVRRRLEGPGGTTTLEPRVLQVLLALAAAQGEVVRRDALLHTCWPGMAVGEDSLNRAIAELRKALRCVGGGACVETIPKTGYRLYGTVAAPKPVPVPVPAAAPAPALPPARNAPSAPQPPVDSVVAPAPGHRVRRRLVAGIALAAAIAGVGAWRSASSRRVSEAILLTERARRIMRDDRWGPVDPLPLLEEALKLDPSDAAAWGLLAIARRDLIWSSPDISEFRAMADCALAAKQAFARDPDQPDALVAMSTMGALFGDWITVEQRLAQIAGRHPRNESVLASLADLYAATGRALDYMATCSRLAALQPDSPSHAINEIRALWACGHDDAMDRRAESAVQAWPSHPGVLRTRAETLGFTRRVDRALAFIERNQLSFDDYPPMVGKALLATFRAYAGRCPLDEAIEAAMAAGMTRQSSAAWVFPLLGSLGAKEQAFELADAYFFARGPLRIPFRFGAPEPRITEMRERQTAQLFMAPAMPLWTESRFLSLCQQVGLMDYWRASGTRPHLLGTAPFVVGS
jgi:DNA-binding winged helix-turn-helix (wHTH) protein